MPMLADDRSVTPVETVFVPLSPDDVKARTDAGLVNVVESTDSRSVASILRVNILTRFNAIISVLLVLILVFGRPGDAMFGLVMVSNALIGIVQELRAKRTLDKLQVLNAPRTTVRRSTGDTEMAATEIVIDDIIVIRRGEQIPVDGAVQSSDGLEVSEALLTGEAEPVVKPVGATVMSGSFVVAGTGVVGVTAVGESSYANKLAAEARRFTLAKSELRTSIDQILRIVTWLIVPTSALLLWSQLETGQSTSDAIVGAVAGVVAMVPQGLVLLVSVALAAAVVRLGQRHVLVQELQAVETLARVNTVCVDKTGTLTSGEIVFDRFVELTDGAIDPPQVLGAIAASDPDPNATMAAIGSAFPQETPPAVTARLAFSSSRKTSAVAFQDGTGWVLGAPEFVLNESDAKRLAGSVAAFTRDGNRVLVVSDCSPESVADGTAIAESPRMLLVFSEDIRPDASDTVSFFAAQDVDVKVISGDAADTVAAVARRIGIGVSGVVDATTLPDSSDPEFDRVVNETNVFGRVKPDQKKAIVAALQDHGKVVAMTGDGVNDVLAVKQADMGIAMGAGTGATHAVAQMVLMDNRFSALPDVVAEGRRVVANMERVASLFLTKTVYATMLALLIGVVGLAFPFLPRHMTLVGAVTIGIPAFVLSFEQQDKPIERGFMMRVLSFAIPAGLVSGLSVFGVYSISRIDRFGFTIEQSRTGATILMVVVGLVILAELVSPVSRRNMMLIGGMFGLFLGILAVPATRNLFELDLPGVYAWIVIGSVSLVAGLILKALLGLSGRRVERRLGAVVR